MKKQTMWLILAGVAVVAAIGAVTALSMRGDTKSTAESEQTAPSPASASTVNSGTQSTGVVNASASDVPANAPVTAPNASTTTKGEYIEYNAEKVAASSAEQTNILFFHAPWCPTCSALNKNIGANTGDIPNNVTIHKVDYDTNTALRKKYGVTYQHTLVQVDASGNQITKWSGGNTLASVVAKIK